MIVPLVPTGMKTGVGTETEVGREREGRGGKWRVEERARPEVAWRWKQREGWGEWEGEKSGEVPGGVKVGDLSQVVKVEGGMWVGRSRGERKSTEAKEARQEDRGGVGGTGG